MSRISCAILLALCTCKEDPKPQGAPPPPSALPSTSACAAGGGQIKDSISALLLPRTSGGYCLDPHGEEKTYGEQGKLEMNAICDTALDGGCEEYKSFGVNRSVIVHYVANDGLASVEVFLSRFGGDGAFAIYTTRLTGETDPADEHAARKLEVTGARGAMGTGKAYVQRGPYFVELTYANDQETPEELKKSSDVILAALAKDIAAKLPSTPDVPASAKALPDSERISNGAMYFPKDVLGVAGAGAGAVGYYKTASERYRIVSVVRDTPDQAKDFIHVLRTRPGAMPVANLGDEAVEVVLQQTPERAKIDWVVVRKGAAVLGVGDEEFSLATKPSKTAKVTMLQTLLK